MHELSVALSILDVAAEQAERLGGARVVAVHLKLGPLAGVVKEALYNAYELAREGSPLADSALVIEETPLVAHCPRCGGPRPVASVQHLCCSECGEPTPHLVSGQELEVVALEVES
jgi:hydrogenase nickel incorporation protein HypA/HybF